MACHSPLTSISPFTTTSLWIHQRVFSPSFLGSILVFQSFPQAPLDDPSSRGGNVRRSWPCTLSYLRSDVVRSPTECGGRHTIQNPFLAHPKVGQLAVTFCIQKDVVQFQIPATWARTTWLMLHSSQYGLLELEREVHLRKICYRKESLKEALTCQQPTSRQVSAYEGQPPKEPSSPQHEGGGSVTRGIAQDCCGY